MRPRFTAKIYAQSCAEEPHGPWPPRDPRPVASLGLPRGYCATNGHACAGKQGAAFGAADTILLRMLENVDIRRRKNLVRRAWDLLHTITEADQKLFHVGRKRFDN